MTIHGGQDHKPRSLSGNVKDLVIDELQATKEEVQEDDHDHDDRDENEGIPPPVHAEKTTSTAVSVCTTPTAKENRIPDPMACPPAPRKRKVSLYVKTHSFSNKIRVVKKFVSSPEIEDMLGINNRVSSKISWSSRKRLRQEKS